MQGKNIDLNNFKQRRFICTYQKFLVIVIKIYNEYPFSLWDE